MRDASPPYHDDHLRYSFKMHLSLSLSFFLLPLLAHAQSSSTITGSVTGTAISGSVGSSSASASSSSTLTADLPSLSGYPACVTDCLQLSISLANCTNIADVNCYCGSSAFTNSLTDCITSTENTGCPSELQAAENLASQFCGLASTSTSLSFTITSVSSSSTSQSSSGSSSGTSTRGSTTSTSTSEPSSATSDNAASALVGTTSNHGALLGLVVALLSAVVGGHLVA